MTPLFANRFAIALPPLWLLGFGAALAAVFVLGCYGLVVALSRGRSRLADEARASLSDGFLGPVAWLVIAMAAVALAATPAVPVRAMLRSLGSLWTAGEATLSISLTAGEAGRKLLLQPRAQEIEEIRLKSGGPLLVRTQQPIEGFALEKIPDIEVLPGREWTWRRGGAEETPFLGTRAELEITNPGDAPVELQVTTLTRPEFPQVAILPWTTIVVSCILAGYLAFRLLARRTAAIASATAKEAIAQPIFGVVLVVGVVLLVANMVIPYNTFGDDVKILKDSGLTLVKVLALIVGVWTASVAVADEIEGRTALTVLSKPLTRRGFFLGKYAGLALVVTLLVLVLGVVLLGTTSLKVVYDARESAKEDPLWRDCASEMITVVPGLVLCLFETLVLAAVSIAVSTRLGLVPNLVITFGVYVLGHLVPLLVQSSVGKFAIVRFFGQLFATLLPVLDHFTIEAAVMGGTPVPWSYLAWAGLYAGLYTTVALLVGLLLFQERDLA
jgi:hypothetical protein